MHLIVVLAKLLVANYLIVHVDGDTQCGKLEERSFNNIKTEVEPLEHAWMGILLKKRGNSYDKTHCSVIIVNKGHVLVPGSCVANVKAADVAALVGIWKKTHTYSSEEYICNDKGFCVLSPMLHSVKEIIFHPNADKNTNNDNVALLELTDPIKYTQYAQPICLQPKLDFNSLTDRNFQFAGFNHVAIMKGKGDGMALSRSLCSKNTPYSVPAHHFCVYAEKRTAYYPGAALLGLNIENEVPQSFYLVGMLIHVHNTSLSTINVFQDLRVLRDWIKSPCKTKDCTSSHSSPIY